MVPGRVGPSGVGIDDNDDARKFEQNKFIFPKLRKGRILPVR